MGVPWVLGKARKDYLFAPRHAEYRQLLDSACACGYEVLSLLEFHQIPDGRRRSQILVLRHDVDNRNPRGVRLFFDLEREYGVRATYYFRLGTLRMKGIVEHLLACGADVGYHFEEAASFAKENRVTSPVELRSGDSRRQIEEMMASNIEDVNAQLGRPVTSLCGHGDFLNLRLGVENREFLSEAVRKRYGILFEAADKSLLDQFDAYFCDVTTEPALWRGDQSPLPAILSGVRRIYVLTHPRHWHPAPLSVTLSNMRRLREELRFRSARRQEIGAKS